MTLWAVSHMAKFETLYGELGQMSQGANTSCAKFTGLLKDLGFEIEDCGSAGHKIAKHPAVSLTEYPDYNCGHNPGAKVKRPYLKKIYRFVKQYKDEIKEHLK